MERAKALSVGGSIGLSKTTDSHIALNIALNSNLWQCVISKELKGCFILMMAILKEHQEWLYKI